MKFNWKNEENNFFSFVGFAGTYPDCYKPQCGHGLIGVFPDCHKPQCATGLIGEYPNCYTTTTTPTPIYLPPTYLPPKSNG